jgi:Raf kinase inhibitor-like YbhB/YbcL family protein
MRIFISSAAIIILVATVFTAVSVAAAKRTKTVRKTNGVKRMAWTLKSPSFSEGQRIPDKFTCVGQNVSPELTWDPAPNGTQEIVLIVDDPDAPMGTWNHWILYGIAPDRTSLPENVNKNAEVKDIGLQGITSSRRPGYGGPCPPPGPDHRYFFKLYALSAKTNLPVGAPLKHVEDAIKGKIIVQAQLMGTYNRSK